MVQDRRGKIGYEAIIIISVTLLTWALNAGVMYERVSNLGDRVSKIENKMDTMIVSFKDHRNKSEESK